MNRKIAANEAADKSVPRVRGDEPYWDEMEAKVQPCSPRARG